MAPLHNHSPYHCLSWSPLHGASSYYVSVLMLTGGTVATFWLLHNRRGCNCSLWLALKNLLLACRGLLLDFRSVMFACRGLLLGFFLFFIFIFFLY